MVYSWLSMVDDGYWVHSWLSIVDDGYCWLMMVDSWLMLVDEAPEVCLTFFFN